LVQAMPWLKRLVAGPSPQRPSFVTFPKYYILNWNIAKPIVVVFGLSENASKLYKMHNLSISLHQPQIEEILLICKWNCFN
jgi:hypothetical protein